MDIGRAQRLQIDINLIQNKLNKKYKTDKC